MDDEAKPVKYCDAVICSCTPMEDDGVEMLLEVYEPLESNSHSQ